MSRTDAQTHKHFHTKLFLFTHKFDCFNGQSEDIKKHTKAVKSNTILFKYS